MKNIKIIIVLIILVFNWSLVAEVWSGLGTGTDHDALALDSSENYIYKSGDFTAADGIR